VSCVVRAIPVWVVVRGLNVWWPNIIAHKVVAELDFEAFPLASP
jgi:hypothetical protein